MCHKIGQIKKPLILPLSIACMEIDLSHFKKITKSPNRTLLNEVFFGGKFIIEVIGISEESIMKTKCVTYTILTLL